MLKILQIFIFFLVPSLALSQINSPEIELYAGGSVVSGTMKPFWLTSNQSGKYSLDPFEGIAGIRVEASDSSASLISFDYGFESYIPVRENGSVILQQGYLEIKTPMLTFRGGMKEETIGNQDSLLSIGSTVWSQNHRPMPKLVIETPGYVDVPFTKGYLEANGSLAHGWFEKDRYVDNVMLHQKHLHLRFGGDFFINASLGLIHFAQWGGISPDPRFGALPSDFDAFTRVFLVQGGDPALVDSSEAKNKLGNHLGSRNYRIDIRADAFSAGLYYQTIFEDNSGASKEFNEDGLLGIMFTTRNKQRWINRVVVERLKTTFQSGTIHDLSGPVKRKGNDDYFNNYVYRSGWSYHGMTLGTPMLTSPVFNQSDEIRLPNNRVIAYHIGIGGMAGKYPYLTYMTYSNNLGTYSQPIDPPKKQFSWYLETTLPEIWRGIDVNIMLAADIGSMYGNNLGAIILLRKVFNPF